nr:unnamed protein product [Callosobruchus chinensis]
MYITRQSIPGPGHPGDKDPVLYAIKQEVPKRALGSNEQPGSAKKSLIQAFRSCSHIWGAAAPITLSILDAVQRRAIRLIGDPSALTCHLQPLSHRRAVEEEARIWKLSRRREDRKCGEAVETAKHIIFDCPALCRRRSSYLDVVQDEGRQAAITAAEELSLAIDFTRRCQQSITELAPAQLKTHIKAAEVEFLLKLHKDKPMHGIFYKHLEEHGLSQQSSGLKSETEGFIMACKDGVFNTLVYRSRVMGVNVPDARCRACRQAPETLMHLLSACKTYAGTAYVHRHNDETPVLTYAPGDIESVVENERCRIYWNYSFPTLELVQATKPDIVLLDHQRCSALSFRHLPRLHCLLVMVIGSLGGMRSALLSALRAMPVWRAAAHILAARIQKAVILGSLRLLRAHDTRTQ